MYKDHIISDRRYDFHWKIPPLVISSCIPTKYQSVPFQDRRKTPIRRADLRHEDPVAPATTSHTLQLDPPPPGRRFAEKSRHIWIIDVGQRRLRQDEHRDVVFSRHLRRPSVTRSTPSNLVRLIVTFLHIRGVTSVPLSGYHHLRESL